MEGDTVKSFGGSHPDLVFARQDVVYDTAAQMEIRVRTLADFSNQAFVGGGRKPG
jgi:hypothetical protein